MPSRRPPRGNYWKQCTTALAPNRQHCFLIYREEVHTVHTATPSQGGKRGTFLIPLAVNALLAILAGLLLGYCTLCRTVIIDSRERVRVCASEASRQGGREGGREGRCRKSSSEMGPCDESPLISAVPPKTVPSFTVACLEKEREGRGGMRGCRNEICFATIFSGTDSYLPSRSLRNRHISFRS